MLPALRHFLTCNRSFSCTPSLADSDSGLSRSSSPEPPFLSPFFMSPRPPSARSTPVNGRKRSDPNQGSEFAPDQAQARRPKRVRVAEPNPPLPAESSFVLEPMVEIPDLKSYPDLSIGDPTFYQTNPYLDLFGESNSSVFTQPDFPTSIEVGNWNGWDNFGI
jgi:hypothetical protein